MSCCPQARTAAPGEPDGAAGLRWCQACGTQVGADARFCAACGSSLTVASTPATAERRLVTVLFCDIVGSSALAARLDPEDYAAILQEYRRCCSDAVARQGGHVGQYVGDGVLACFGYPQALGRDAELATECGLDLVRSIADLAHSAKLPGIEQLSVRVGIETGLVVAGRLSEDRVAALDSLVGTALNTAARLQQFAPPFGVLIGEATHELVSSSFDCEALPRERIEHLRPQIQNAYLVRARTTPQGAGRRALAGRQVELAQLSARWLRSQRKVGQAVLVSGESGIGKSRLIQAFLAGAMPGQGEILLTCTPQGTATPFHAAIAALHRWLEFASGSVPERAHRLLERLAEASGVAFALLEEVLGRGGKASTLAPAERRRALMEILRTWLLDEKTSGEARLVIVEDLHWSDPSLLELLRSVCALLPGHRAMFLATCRSGQVPEELGALASLHLTLKPLTWEEAGALLDSFSPEPVPSAVRAQILARADGVPLFIEELALTARDTLMPRTLQQAFVARLDALGPAKPLAQLAAVLGSEADRELLGEVSRLDAPALDVQLRRLKAAEVLAPGAGIAFRHGLLQQAAYESLLHAERRRLHAQVADLLESRRPALAAGRPELVASHRAAALQHRRAVTLFARAVALALEGSALGEAEELARRGLASAGALPWPEAGQAELELRILLGRAMIGRRGYASIEVRDAFERAEQLATTLHDDRRNLALLRGLASFYQVRGPLSRARALCERLTAVAEVENHPWALADALRRQAWNDLCMGDIPRAEAGLSRAIGLLGGAPAKDVIAITGHDTHALAMANASWLGTLRHGAKEAAAIARRTAAAATDSPHAVSACYAFAFAASALQSSGRWDEARALAERCRAVALEKGIAYWIAMSEVVLGRDSVRRGAAEDGRDAILRGLEDYQRTEGELLRPYILSQLAEAELALGAPERSVAALVEAEQVAERLEARVFVPPLLIRRAALQHGKQDELLRRAEAMAREQGSSAVTRSAARRLR